MLILKKIILGFLIFVLFLLGFFFVGYVPQAEEIIWGVNFSQKHSQNLGLNWRENYLALLEDLEVKNLRIAAHWDLIEPEQGEYYFEDLDWQIEQAKNYDAKVILIIGMKTGRWPECHLPKWAVNLDKTKQQDKILSLLKKIVSRYENSEASSVIEYWQIENEPLYPFGDCPWRDAKFLKKEVNLVKSLDSQQRPIIINSTGEWSLWLKEAKIGDIVGTSLYRIIWAREIKTYIFYRFPPVYFWRRAQVIKKIFNKEVICVELQAEPWGPALLYDSPLEEQKKTMNLEQFKKNIEFAKKTGLDAFYLWGGEWWYWLKIKQGQPEIWNQVKIL
jgi:hypothetical protein